MEVGDAIWMRAKKFQELQILLGPNTGMHVVWVCAAAGIDVTSGAIAPSRASHAGSWERKKSRANVLWLHGKRDLKIKLDG